MARPQSCTAAYASSRTAPVSDVDFDGGAVSAERPRHAVRVEEPARREARAPAARERAAPHGGARDRAEREAAVGHAPYRRPALGEDDILRRTLELFRGDELRP